MSEKALSPLTIPQEMASWGDELVKFEILSYPFMYIIAKP